MNRKTALPTCTPLFIIECNGCIAEMYEQAKLTKIHCVSKNNL